MLGGYTSPTTVPSPRCWAGPGRGAGSGAPHPSNPDPQGALGAVKAKTRMRTGTGEKQDLRPLSLLTKLGRNLPGG